MICAGCEAEKGLYRGSRVPGNLRQPDSDLHILPVLDERVVGVLRIEHILLHFALLVPADHDIHDLLVLHDGGCRRQQVHGRHLGRHAVPTTTFRIRSSRHRPSMRNSCQHTPVSKGDFITYQDESH